MAFLFFICILISSFSLDMVRINTNTRKFIDSQNRSIIFHGVNAVYKVPPFVPSTNDTFDPMHSLNDQDAQNLSDWGVNIVRLGIEWPGLIPGFGLLNMTYMYEIEKIVNTLGNHGIYTILDNHQDLLSRYFCGEGIPDFLVPSLNPAKEFPKPNTHHIDYDNVTGYPTLKSCYAVGDFGQLYYSDKVSKAFQDMYNKSTLIYEQFLLYWDKISTYFAENPNVVGYELINEPWLGDIYTYPKERLESGYTDKEFLAPLYEELNDIIRDNDKNHIIFFESAVADYFEIGFTHAPGGVNYNNLSSYAFHVYCPFVNKSGVPRSEFICHEYDTVMVNLRSKDAKKLGVPGLMTEFGALDNSKGAIKEANYMMDKADSNLEGYLYWTFKGYEDITTANQDGSEAFYLKDGTLQVDKVKALSRTYPQYVFGDIQYLYYNSNNGDFSLDFTIQNADAMGDTKIYYNKPMNYPNGVTYDINDQNFTVNVGDKYISLTQTAPLPIGHYIKFKLHRK